MISSKIVLHLIISLSNIFLTQCSLSYYFRKRFLRLLSFFSGRNIWSCRGAYLVSSPWKLAFSGCPDRSLSLRIISGSRS